MDPLAIIASTIAILQAGGAVGVGLRKLISLKDAPAIVLQLNNDAADLELVIRAVAGLPSTIREKKIVCAAVQRAKAAVLEFEECVAYCLTSASSTSSVIKVRRRKWVSAAEDKIRELRLSLRETKLDLITATGVVNVASTYTIAVHVENISLRTSQIESQLQQLIKLYTENAHLYSQWNYETFLKRPVEAEQSQNVIRGEEEQLLPFPQDATGLSKFGTAPTATDSIAKAEDNNGVSPYCRFWDTQLANGWRDSDIYGSFDPDVYGYNDLIKALLGFGVKPLHSTISATSRANIDERDRTGRTALGFAAATGNIDAVEYLLKKGADPNHEDTEKQTPLFYAVRYHHSKCVQLLLDAGANNQHVDSQGISLLAVAVSCSCEVSILDGLYNCKIDLNARARNGETSLSCFAMQRYFCEEPTRSIEVLNWLLEHGADINAQEGNGQTATMRAMRNGNHRMLELLLQRGADIAKSDMDGRTLLHYATYYGDLDMFYVLQAAGLQTIKLNARDRHSKSAIEDAGWRRSQNEEWSHSAVSDMDADPEKWYSTFKGLYLSILALQWDVTVEDVVEQLSEKEEEYGRDWEGWIDDYLDELDKDEESDDGIDITNKIPGAFPDD
ncbi:hypothetical protein MMC17_003290 [Xylographa soralifera]|nr:hypothetical protein [Xylographa soralifera]